MKNFGERHHTELVTLLCLLVAMHPSGILLPVTGADVDPSISFSNISTTAAGRTSHHSLQTKAQQLHLHLFKQQNHQSLPNSIAEL
jgi:hypothetical protein